MVRILSILGLAFAFSAQAGDQPMPPQQPIPHPHPHPVPAPAPGPRGGFCDGFYDGYSFHQGPLSLTVQEVGPYGQVEVTMMWAGMTYVGGGICQQTSPCQAALNFQFPNAP